MEVMLVLLIMSIAAVLSLDAISGFEAAQRPERAARESLTFFRLARNLAMTTGKRTRVSIDTANRTVTVAWNQSGDWNGTTGTFVTAANSMTSSGTCVLNLNSSRELTGTTISLNPSTATEFDYTALGNCARTGTVTFTYGGRSKSLTIAKVGDPTLQ
jgi:type II secretory pathway pseudopilin PulG